MEPHEYRTASLMEYADENRGAWIDANGEANAQVLAEMLCHKFDLGLESPMLFQAVQGVLLRYHAWRMQDGKISQENASQAAGATRVKTLTLALELDTYQVEYATFTAADTGATRLVVSYTKNGAPVSPNNLTVVEINLLESALAAAGWGRDSRNALGDLSKYLESRERLAAARFNKISLAPHVQTALDNAVTFAYGPRGRRQDNRENYRLELENAARSLAGSFLYGNVDLSLYYTAPPALAYLAYFIPRP